MFETILHYLQWAVPGGIGAAIAWLLSRDLRRTRTAKEVHDTYKEMYSDVSRSLTEMREENEKLYKAIIRLERAVQRANTCRYWYDCPIRSELPESSYRGTDDHQRRQPAMGKPRIRDSGDTDTSHNGGQCRSDNTDEGDTEPSRGRRVFEQAGTDTPVVEEIGRQSDCKRDYRQCGG